MITLVVPEAMLRQIVPDTFAEFERAYRAAEIGFLTAIQVLWEEDAEEAYELGILETDDPQATYDSLVSAWDKMAETFRNETENYGKSLGIQCQFNDEEMEDYGAYVRLRTSDLSHPFVKKYLELFELKELTVYQREDLWAEEA